MNFCLHIGGALRGRGWKYGSGFVDGVFPVLSPRAQEILKFLQKECDVSKTWASLDTLTPTHSSWDDLINVAIQLRCSKHWDSVVSVRTTSTILVTKVNFTSLVQNTSSLLITHACKLHDSEVNQTL